jgi:acetate kinase
MAAATGGIDVPAFTGGVGEYSPLVRQRAAQRLGFLGVALAPSATMTPATTTATQRPRERRSRPWS